MINKEITDTIAYNLKYYRLEKGINQKDLANLIGVTNKRLSNWERGLSRPKQELLDKICEVLNISIKDLTTPQSDKNKKDSFFLSYDEHILLSKFHNLDEKGKKFILTVLKHEEERMVGRYDK